MIKLYGYMRSVVHPLKRRHFKRYRECIRNGIVPVKKILKKSQLSINPELLFIKTMYRTFTGQTLRVGQLKISSV